MIVVDASVLAVAIADDCDGGRRARQRLRGEHLAAPALVDLEVLSVLRRRARRAAVHPQRAQQALHDLMDIPPQRVPHRHLLQRSWELRDNATAYDAADLALAELLSGPLLTADERLAEIPGTTCSVDVFR